METNELIKKIIVATICVLILVGVCVVIFPTCRRIYNNIFHRVQEVDDVTDYETIKKVEDTCRSMIASYNSDKLMYEQYKDSDSSEKQSWAEQAKMRANKTASSYNEYILKNRYVWKDNVPEDIKEELPYIK